MYYSKRKYSVIVVTLNNAEGLSRTLASIRALNNASLQTIVIDGESQDHTSEVLSANSDIIDVALSEKDSGIYNAMNKGVRLITGDYAVFMNAGDVFADSKVLSVIDKVAGDIILGGEKYGEEERRVKPEMTLYDILSIGINHQAVYYRREILQKYGFDESYQLIADLKSVVEPLVKERISISSVPEILAICEGGGISKNRWRETIAENQRLIEEVIDPFYRKDYQRFARINNEMINDFVTLSYFRSVFPLLRFLSRMMRIVNYVFNKNIPI